MSWKPDVRERAERVRQTRDMITKKRHRDGHTKVVFSLPDAGQPVSLVADFNGWDPTAHPLRKRSNGVRSVAVMLPPGTCTRFRYVSGDQYFDDPDGDGFEPNDFGSTNTVLAV
jgi:1,4-alpha-glucan branching enzyme